MTEPIPDFEPRIPSLAQVEQAFMEVGEYNRQHTGFGSVFKRILNAVVKVEGEHNEVVDHLGEAEIAKDIVHMTMQPALEGAGLHLIDSGTIVFGAMSKPATGSEQEVSVKDPVQYLGFLETVSGNDLEDKPALRDGVVSVWNSIVNATVKAAASDDAETQEFSKNGVDLVNRLLPEYQRLAYEGVGVNLENAVKLSNWSERPEFNDYFKAEALMREKGYFSIEQWHTDSPPESFTKKWDAVLDQYEKVVGAYGQDNDVAIIMRGRIMDAIEEGGTWLQAQDTATGNNLKQYTDNLRVPMQKAWLRSAALGIS
jgi:hypothetical protein